VKRGQRTNIVWLTEEVFKNEAPNENHIINYMRPNKVYIQRWVELRVEMRVERLWSIVCTLAKH
jgi:hypothetical protein